MGNLVVVVLDWSDALMFFKTLFKIVVSNWQASDKTKTPPPHHSLSLLPRGSLEPAKIYKAWTLSCLRPAPPLRPSAALGYKEVALKSLLYRSIAVLILNIQ